MTHLPSSSSIGQAPDARVKAVVEFGFTDRQARFLVTVMLPSGVCLLCQYTTFAGIVHGQKTRKFFTKLVRHGFATAYPCRHNRGRVYHVHHKPLYRAIGETDSRHRRPLSAARVVDNLILLDALPATPSAVWLANEEEQHVHLSGLGGISRSTATRRSCTSAAGCRTSASITPGSKAALYYIVMVDRLTLATLWQIVRWIGGAARFEEVRERSSRQLQFASTFRTAITISDAASVPEAPSMSE